MSDNLTHRKRLALRIIFWIARVLFGRVPFGVDGREELTKQLDQFAEALRTMLPEEEE